MSCQVLYRMGPSRQTVTRCFQSQNKMLVLAFRFRQCSMQTKEILLLSLMKTMTRRQKNIFTQIFQDQQASRQQKSRMKKMRALSFKMVYLILRNRTRSHFMSQTRRIDSTMFLTTSLLSLRISNIMGSISTILKIWIL